MRRPASIVLACLVSLMSLAAHGAAEAEARELEIFKTWLTQKYAGYGCDEGPAQFRNAAVEAAYGGRRFYYVLTHARGIPPPFKNALSLVAFIDDHGDVQSLDASSLATYRLGLGRVTRPAEARRAAAAVLILSLGDPGQRRWPIQGRELHGQKRETRVGLHVSVRPLPRFAGEIRQGRPALGDQRHPAAGAVASRVDPHDLIIEALAEHV